MTELFECHRCRSFLTAPVSGLCRDCGGPWPRQVRGRSNALPWDRARAIRASLADREVWLSSTFHWLEGVVARALLQTKEDEGERIMQLLLDEFGKEMEVRARKVTGLDQ